MPNPNNRLPPPWMTDGALVWYYPIANNPERFSGVVAETPWRLAGDNKSEWVVRLKNMCFTYRNGEKNHVPAAACWALQRRDEC